MSTYSNPVPGILGYGFYGPVGPRGRKDRCTFAFSGSEFVVISVSAGNKPVPVSRLVGTVCTTPHGEEMASTWGAGHWTNEARTVVAHLRKWAAIEEKKGNHGKAVILGAAASYFEGIIPAEQAA